MRGRLAVLTGFLLTIFLPLLPTKPVHAASLALPTLIISEIKLGGDSYSQGTGQPKDPQEYITLYNASDNSVTLDNWLLEYAKPTFNKNYCDSSSWASHSVSGSASATKLSGVLSAGQVSAPIIRSLTDNIAGSLHLVNASAANNPVIEDLVGWGASAPCAEITSTAIPSNGKGLKRYLDCNTDYPIDTNNNSSDFIANQPPSPGALNNPYITSCQDAVTSAQTLDPQPTCEGIIITELLPNPAGTDTGNEFIELYNPTTAAISLAGCSIQTTASQKVYSFDNVALAPGQFQAFYDSQTGLSLPNAAGGTVWLLSPTTELQSITYPANLDDVAWAMIADGWSATYQPTPNANNILLETKPCPSGQERSPDTGRCRNILTLNTSTIGACPAGQERNLQTSRCRAVAIAASSLTPCRPGQERNPATNRCRSVASASASPKDCPAGQARNPATNRCRKTIATNLGNIRDVKSATVTTGGAKWLIAGGSILAAAVFGFYEWRQEIMLKFIDFKTKLRFS